MVISIPPIDSLPVELLSEIFQITYHLGESPWTFTQISRHWRALALNMPRLWAKIQFLPLKPESRNADGYEKCRNHRELREAIFRSKGAPLEMEMCSVYSSFISDGDVLPSILNPFANQIERLTLSTWSYALPDISRTYTHLVTEPLRSLKELTLYGDMRLIFNQRLLKVVDSTSDGLQELGIISQSSLPPPDLSLWSRLTKIVVGFDISFPILSQFVNVRNLYLQCGLEPSLSVPVPRITLPKLEYLTLRDPHFFFTCIDTPVLHTLHIQADHYSPTPSPPIQVPSLVELEIFGRFSVYEDFYIAPYLKSMRLHCNHYGRGTISSRKIRKDHEPNRPSKLESLELKNVNIELDVLKALLRRHPDVKQLRLHQVTCTPDIIPALAAVQDGKPEKKMRICPSLERLFIQFASKAHSQRQIQSSLRSVVSARERIGHPLTELILQRFRLGKAIVSENLVSLDYTPDDEQSDCENCSKYHYGYPEHETDTC